MNKKDYKNMKPNRGPSKKSIHDEIDFVNGNGNGKNSNGNGKGGKKK